MGEARIPGMTRVRAFGSGVEEEFVPSAYFFIGFSAMRTLPGVWPNEP